MSGREIFKMTLPVMAGYVPLGMAFGLFAVGQGLPAWVAMATALLIYAGSVEFMLVAFIISGASLGTAFVISFLLNFRHFFYTLGMLDQITHLKHKLYFIYALTDETYALLKTKSGDFEPKDLDKIFNLTALFHQIYWVLGVSAGAWCGELLKLDFAGIEFSLTALFAVLTIAVLRQQKSPPLAILSAGVGLVGLFVFPREYYLFGTITAGVAILAVFRRHFGARV